MYVDLQFIQTAPKMQKSSPQGWGHSDLSLDPSLHLAVAWAEMLHTTARAKALQLQERRINVQAIKLPGLCKPLGN